MLSGTKTTVFVTGLYSLLTGCDIGYGITRSAALRAVPPLECVHRVVESTPGIVSVNYSHNEDGTTLTLKSPAHIADTFFYSGREGSYISGILQIHQDHRGTVSLSQNLTYLNARPPQSDIDASRPVMAQIEQRLESECGITGLVKNITERCAGVECPKL